MIYSRYGKYLILAFHTVYDIHGIENENEISTPYIRACMQLSRTFITRIKAWNLRCGRH